ncbi:DAK2 domain-containing protein [Tranquillimonas rosea]|uniref:DAK2 domain-containing protein n=1 Tax=Tranquillimonas rosea TaxID=641238 RepID=UPI003BA8C372
MTESYDIGAVQDALRRLAAALRGEADRLTELDQKVGDGDLGITAKKVADALDAHAAEGGDDLGQYIGAAGMAANRVASSTMGTLLATAAMRAGKVVKGASALEPAQLAEMLQAAAQGMAERGKANRGDKTILDAIFPAAEALRDAVDAGRPLAQAGQEMVDAAAKGRDEVTPLRSRIGRAGWVGERTEGLVDPGCALCVVALASLAGREENR